LNNSLNNSLNDPFLPEELRLFIACELPETWIGSLGEAMRELARAGLKSLRWVRPEGIHLTLKFLGDAGRHLLPDLELAMNEACAGQREFELRLAGLGSFGGRRGVRVLWAGIDGDLEVLKRLQARVDDAVSRLGFARELRPFSPHLTLARVPESAPPDVGALIAAALKKVSIEPVDPFVVREIGLIWSQLGPGGARYTPLVSSAFALHNG
jgi:RNA 2',3'-cyclic 3'-phosphodiesterase